MCIFLKINLKTCLLTYLCNRRTICYFQPATHYAAGVLMFVFLKLGLRLCYKEKSNDFRNKFS